MKASIGSPEPTTSTAQHSTAQQQSHPTRSNLSHTRYNPSVCRKHLQSSTSNSLKWWHWAPATQPATSARDGFRSWGHTDAVFDHYVAHSLLHIRNNMLRAFATHATGKREHAHCRTSKVQRQCWFAAVLTSGHLAQVSFVLTQSHCHVVWLTQSQRRPTSCRQWSAARRPLRSQPP